MQTGELRPKDAPTGYEALGLDAFARRLGCSRKTAHRRMQHLLGLQHREDVFRVVRLRVRIGCGGQRAALHGLWPTLA